MESKKINQLATELSPDLSDLTIIGDPTTGISKKITLSQMASLFTGTVEEYANLAAFPLVGVADTIYIAQDTNIIYRWSGSAYVELSPNVVSSLVFNDANGFDGTIVLASSVATLTITTALTLGSLPFIGASGALTQDNANLFYDDTNNRLGIGTNAPTTVLDVFGSGIIARINGTSTNNGFLGFSNAGTNKWSVGNVQSDHRFRIYSEANSAELVSVLQTGEFGIGIANPLTKFHVDGGATALIANLDANVSVAKSLSFRSDNSARINLEVSGTESGSNVGADFFIRRYTDLGALIDTPLTITRSTGLITLATALSGTSATFSGQLSLASTITNGTYTYTLPSATGTLALTSALSDYLPLTGGTLTGNANFQLTNAASPSISIRRSSSSYDATINYNDNGSSRWTVGLFGDSTADYKFYNAGSGANSIKIGYGTDLVTLAGALSGTSATFSGLITGQNSIYQSNASGSIASNIFETYNGGATELTFKYPAGGSVAFSNGSTRFSLASTGAATFSSGISVGGATATTGGIQFPATAVAIADGNNLDDYEEGTWTPTWSSGGGTINTNVTYTAGTYTKIGNVVHIWARLYTNSVSAPTGVVTVSGLPFTVGTQLANQAMHLFTMNAINATLTGTPIIYFPASTSTGIILNKIWNSSEFTGDIATYFDNDTWGYFYGSYNV